MREVQSGIYQIVSKSHPDRMYIGSSFDIHTRICKHMTELRAGKHHSKKLQYHYNKYGGSDLSVSILMLCSVDELLRNEQEFMDKLHPYFNMRPMASSNLGHKHAAESIAKFRLSKSLLPKKACVYCGFETNNYACLVIWHDENCKHNPNRQPNIITCPHCDKQAERSPVFIRFHFDNCNKNPDYAPIYVTCPHCDSTYRDSPVMRGRHFNNCKFNKHRDGYAHMCPHCGKKDDGSFGFSIRHGDHCIRNPEFKPTMHYCIHCGYGTTSPSNLLRYHHDNCKLKPNVEL